MMIEYSIADLKYYYSNYDNATAIAEYTADDVENIQFLEDKLSDMIDDEYTQNSIYHIFPGVATFAFLTLSSLLLGVFLG